MDDRTQHLFASLVGVQAAHAAEEYTFALWEVWPLAHRVSSAVGGDLATGFAIVNTSFVAFGLGCYWIPIRRQHSSARGIAYAWVALELGNGVGHLLMALWAGGYFPGLYTAPFLLVSATALLVRLLR